MQKNCHAKAYSIHTSLSATGKLTAPRPLQQAVDLHRKSRGVNLSGVITRPASGILKNPLRKAEVPCIDHVDRFSPETIHIMLQMCMGSCCRHHMQYQRAVDFTNHQGAFQSPHTTFPDYLQTQLANWQSSSHHDPYHQPHYTQPYNMAATQQDNGDNGTWLRSHAGREENGPLTSAWANVHLSHPQPEPIYGHQSFFADGMDYHPEEAALFIPPRANPIPGAAPHPMDAVPTSFAPQTTRENDATTAMRLLQTNVDVTQFGPVYHEDWRKASIDLPEDEEDAPSPALTEATSHGPFTPVGFDGEAGLTEAAMRKLSHNLSSSFDSLTSDPFEGMFKDATAGSIRAFEPWEISRAYGPTAPQAASFGTQFSRFASNRYAGLPMLARNVQSITIHDGEAPFSQGPFRDVDGLPTEATMPFPLPKRCRTTQLAIEPVITESSGSRKERDQYLLDMREKGWTYKDIKERGDFPEAESTLRGRVRVLTKDRSERVRKPEWTDRDVRLLRRGVAFIDSRPAASGSNKRRRTGKLPWKDISAYIRQHGGSYSFAPATCARKWDEVIGED